MDIMFLVTVFCLYVVSVSSQADKLLQNPCVLKQTCHECIQTPSCAWCSDPSFKDNSKRCFQPNQVLTSPCDPKYIFNPDNEYSVLMAKKLTKLTQISGSSASESGSYGSFSSSSSSSMSSSSSSMSSSSSSMSSSSSSSSHYNDIVQISPQVVNLKLRMNEAYRINVDYSQAVAYPVDLYYLMDLSKSMNDDKDKLSSLGNLLAETMKNMTSNFRLGFGSFVDKVVMPYVSILPQKLIEPCDECVAPYGFLNHMPLNRDTEMFSVEVEKANVSGNLDAPEGGFDAIMQAIVCRDKIGWRDKARRLLVFSTDAGFHYAGDGKLGGIVKPNDGECHIDETGHYTHSTIQDYPSVSQINWKVKQNSINIIFAVTNDKYSIYEKLSRHIEGSFAGVLSNDSSNIVELVKDQYNKITQTVEMRDTSSSSHVKVNYYSDCNDPKGDLVATNKCDGLKVDSQIRFQVELVAKSCPLNRDEWKQTFKIYPVGINESLTVQLELLCDCPCENPNHPDYIVKADQCSGYGTYKCGICECDDSHFGRNCECDAQNAKQDENGLGCRPDNTTSIDCSGRGTCTCGQCQCEERPNPLEKITGAYCECDNFSCDRVDGILCSGPEHGSCVCGKCECNPEWSGPDCSCSTRQDTCIPPGGGEICSGKGTCKCGKCECTTAEEGRYSGRYCEKCPTCPGRCLELKDCVQCQIYKKGPLSEEECAANCTFVPSVHEVIETDESKEENLCSYFDEDDCRYTFVYTYDEKGKLVVRAKEERDCPQPVYVLGIVMGVIGAIVLIGLALLFLWKLLTTIHDRREFARFEKERMMAKWETGENPIFKQATSSFKNPTYAGH